MKKLNFVKTFELFGYDSKSSIETENKFKKYLIKLKDRGYDFTKPIGKSPYSHHIYTDPFRNLSMHLKGDNFWIDVKLEPNLSKGKCEVLMRKIIQDGEMRKTHKTENLPVVNLDIDNNFVDSLISLFEQQL
jgi:hypothetical protein